MGCGEKNLFSKRFFPAKHLSLTVLGDKAFDSLQCFDDLIFGCGVAGADIAFAAGAEGGTGNYGYAFFLQQFFGKFPAGHAGTFD